ncbi:MAG: hypothetical protein ACO23R_02615 [bacterium]
MAKAKDKNSYNDYMSKAEILLSVIAYSGGNYSVQEIKQIMAIIESYEHREATISKLRLENVLEQP